MSRKTRPTCGRCAVLALLLVAASPARAADSCANVQSLTAEYAKETRAIATVKPVGKNLCGYYARSMNYLTRLLTIYTNDSDHCGISEKIVENLRQSQVKLMEATQGVCEWRQVD